MEKAVRISLLFSIAVWMLLLFFGRWMHIGVNFLNSLLAVAPGIETIAIWIGASGIIFSLLYLARKWLRGEMRIEAKSSFSK